MSEVGSTCALASCGRGFRSLLCIVALACVLTTFGVIFLGITWSCSHVVGKLDFSFCAEKHYLCQTINNPVWIAWAIWLCLRSGLIRSTNSSIIIIWTSIIAHDGIFINVITTRILIEVEWCYGAVVGRNREQLAVRIRIWRLRNWLENFFSSYCHLFLAGSFTIQFYYCFILHKRATWVICQFKYWLIRVRISCQRISA